MLRWACKILIQLLLAVFCSHSSLAAERPPVRNVLIVIGYSDFHEIKSIKDLFKNEYNYSRSQWIESQVRTWLGLLNFSNSPASAQTFVQNQNGAQVTILNPNFLCQGESPIASNRAIVCQEQSSRSALAMAELNANIGNYDEFIYIGHSRGGMGLAVGPFNPENTYDFRFYNLVEMGNLKRLVIASCDSENYYRRKIPLSFTGDFVGTNGDKDITSELLPMVLEELRSL